MSQDVIDNLYHAFRKVPQPIKIEGCTVCCVTEEELNDLEKGIHSAAKSSVSTLAHNGMSTVGSADDYKYFLPRILHEMIEDEEFWFLCEDALTRRIKQAGFDNWTIEEKAKTLDALKVIFEKQCKSTNIIELEYWIHALIIAGFDISHFLKLLDKPEHELTKATLILNRFEFPKYKGANKVCIGSDNVTTKQFQPIKDWVENTLKV